MREKRKKSIEDMENRLYAERISLLNSGGNGMECHDETDTI